jgi:molybdate transport system substrate-binding protein
MANLRRSAARLPRGFASAILGGINSQGTRPMAQPLSIMSTLALQGVLDVLAPLWAKTNPAPAMVFDPTKSISQRIADGARGDIAILTAAAVDDFIAKGVFAQGSRRDLALSHIGVAVAAGAARPDISTPEAFRATLLATPSLAYSRAGASGLFFAGLIERLGIAAEVNAKATVIPQGFTGELLKRGEVALAIQQVSELMTVPGIDIIGTLPAKIGEVMTFSAAIFAEAPQPEAARAFMEFLVQGADAKLLRAKGLESV